MSVKRVITAMVAAAAILPLSVAPAHAGPVGEGCFTDFWMWGLRTAERMICDGYRAADGSWERRRGFFDSAYTTNAYSSCYRYGCTYYPPRYVPELSVIDPPYRLTDATIPGGEPGYIESAEPRIVQ